VQCQPTVIAAANSGKSLSDVVNSGKRSVMLHLSRHWLYMRFCVTFVPPPKPSF
jgi:hypothetical protein